MPRYPLTLLDVFAVRPLEGNLLSARRIRGIRLVAAWRVGDVRDTAGHQIEDVDVIVADERH